MHMPGLPKLEACSVDHTPSNKEAWLAGPIICQLEYLGENSGLKSSVLPHLHIAAVTYIFCTVTTAKHHLQDAKDMCKIVPLALLELQIVLFTSQDLQIVPLG